MDTVRPAGAFAPGAMGGRCLKAVEWRQQRLYTSAMIPEDNRTQETQQELFTEFSASPKRPERFPTLAKSHKPILLSTTTEQLLLIGILAVLVLCAVFFLGVLRGKSLRPEILPVSRTYVQAPPVPVKTAVKTLAPAVAMIKPQIPAPAPLVLNTEKPYTIQVVTHRKREYAENEMAAIKRLGYVSFLIPSGEYFQVCAGQYKTKDEAKKDLALFSAKYKDCFLRRR
jgi:hypothetical protein